MARQSIATPARRAAETCAMFMIGNGALGLLQAERRITLWSSAVPAVDAFVRADRRRTPGQRRLAAAAQIAAGLLLATWSSGRHRVSPH